VCVLDLYDAAGYRRVSPFGRYEKEPLAVAFEKRLEPAMARTGA
jgi:hypothetical protein